MKNRYFGDKHDFVKYSLLRSLGNQENAKIVVCWLLTEDDDGMDGKHIKYLKEPKKWCKYDPPLFRFLRREVFDRNVRNVKVIEEGNMLPNCKFYSTVLTDDSTQRTQFFNDFFTYSQDSNTLFFDPDNGIVVKSVKYGRKKSSKYLYWAEIQEAINEKYSLMIYQHLPWQPREQYINKMVGKIKHRYGENEIYVIRNGHVSFFLIVNENHQTWIQEAIIGFENRWKDAVRVTHYMQ